ncbi:MAG: hypothetical protein JXR96_18490 [Deltaproteobacteria bacterium]|nr:hypothetical protein [Deltaproteobacteria bacterium]
MRRVTLLIAALAICAIPLSAAASSAESVGLGVALGVAFPEGADLKTEVVVDDWDPSFNWGFYVNIPLISTFHITPSAELYQIGEQNATDISIAFKFIVPIWLLDIYVGVVPGLTTIADIHAMNVGGLVGLSFNMIANLDFFVQAKYKIMFHGDHNVRTLHGHAGVLFTF